MVRQVSLDVNPVCASNEKDATDLAPIVIEQNSHRTRGLSVASSCGGCCCNRDRQRRRSPRYRALHRIEPPNALLYTESAGLPGPAPESAC